jgi:hypothetical protein
MVGFMRRVTEAQLKEKIAKLYQQREKIHLLSANCRKSVEPYVLEEYIKKILDLANEKDI